LYSSCCWVWCQCNNPSFYDYVWGTKPYYQACAIEAIEYVVEFGDYIKENNNIFGVDSSMEKSSHALVVGELSLFRKLFVTFTTCVDPLAWW